MESVINHPLFVPIVLTICLIGLIPLVAGYLSLVERKVLADFQVRLGPMRVGPHGLFQPIADALKLVLKEDIIPENADKAIFWLAPVRLYVHGPDRVLGAAVFPYVYVADVNIGILVISAMSAVGILGIILGGWSSNSHYPLLGALRSAAQLVSYEVAMGFALVSGLMAAGTLSMQGIVRTQMERGIWLVFDNYGFMIVPSCCSSSPPRRRPTARRSTCLKRNPSWWQASIPSTAASVSRSSSWPSMPTCWWSRPWG